MKKLIFLELNEINLDFVKYYISMGLLPNWKFFIDEYGVQITKSESNYCELEPWVIWPSIRTGLAYSEHKIFRLGDISNAPCSQHWEILESAGFSVAAVSPINGANNTKNSPFWIPDPWVNTKVSGDAFLMRLARAVKQTVNDNSKDKITIKSALTIIESLFTKTKLSSLPTYLSSIFGAFMKRHWSKAILLDRLLVDIYLGLWKKHRPDFSTLFLNAGAHIQHHYMISSRAYKGAASNPIWYVPKECDPLYDILKMYDSVLLELRKFSDTRLMICAGLQQVPHETPTFYWRLREHQNFLKKLNIKFKNVYPRMTRDFLVEFDCTETAKNAELILRSIKTASGEAIFGDIDNRGNELFVTLTYPHDINDSLIIHSSKFGLINNFWKDVVFVAIKNGHHDGSGFLIDTDRNNSLKETIEVKTIFDEVMSHFNIKFKIS